MHVVLCCVRRGLRDSKPNTCTTLPYLNPHDVYVGKFMTNTSSVGYVLFQVGRNAKIEVNFEINF